MPNLPSPFATWRRLRFLLTASIVSACASKDAPIPSISATEHEAAIIAWRTDRDTKLRTPGRPPSFTGLAWLHEGRNTIGSADSNAVHLVGTGVAPTIGTLVRTGTTVRFEPAPRAAVLIDSQPATAMVVRSDAEKPTTAFAAGSAGFRIIRRLDSLGVRTWDSQRKELLAFAPLEYFPISLGWRTGGRLKPYDKPKTVAVMTELGVLEEQKIIGTVGFQVGAAPYEFVAYEGNDPTDLFFVFKDATNTKETYGFRFLHAVRDTVTNSVVLDFNYAFSPDCAFTPYATCPLPPKENRITGPVPAGEKAPAH